MRLKISHKTSSWTRRRCLSAPRSLRSQCWRGCTRSLIGVSPDEARRRARAGRPLELVEVADDRGHEYGRATGHVLGAAIRGLPDEQRRIVVMKLLEGRPFAEIAALVGVSEAACKMRFARALRLLRVELAREGLRP